jgi:hypothetical protein
VVPSDKIVVLDLKDGSRVEQGLSSAACKVQSAKSDLSCVKENHPLARLLFRQKSLALPLNLCRPINSSSSHRIEQLPRSADPHPYLASVSLIAAGHTYIQLDTRKSLRPVQET